MKSWWGRLFKSRSENVGDVLAAVRAHRTAYADAGDDELARVVRDAAALPAVLAATTAAATRELGLEMFDEQIEAAWAMANGRIAEMKTGEGKTLAAVPAAVWHARRAGGVHVLTANDYLARRDAEWMRGIYERLGLSVGVIQQGMTPAARRSAYGCAVTYATATEVGFDLLRDGLARHPAEQVHRPFAAALVDEADSILIDEARIPLVIASGDIAADDLAVRADASVRGLQPGLHFAVDRHGRDVALTDEGIRAVEGRMRCASLFDEGQLAVFSAVQNALHAHVLLRRDVDYVVRGGALLSVDELKGRVVHGRRWPAALQTALETKEGLAANRQGSVMGSITLQNLVALYAHLCGMTGTAARQAVELQQIYGLDVHVVPPHRPVARVDRPDAVFERRTDKEAAVLAEVRRRHATGQPVLVGTASVEESERLSRALSDVPHHVLNARNEEAEAAVIAAAGQAGAVTLSTNMAGRGVDIRLGPGVAERGGLHVIGTHRHASRRIDDQLRGRAGRQGDPGSSQFFVSMEDDLFVRHAEPGVSLTADELQRVLDGRSLDLRLFLEKYESVVEGQRRSVQAWRQDVLTGSVPCATEVERLATLAAIDDAWAEHLAAVAERREGTVWIALGGGAPHHTYLKQVHELFVGLRERVEEDVRERVARAEAGEWDPSRPGATWTYLTTDQPFGSLTDRLLKGFGRMVKRALR